MGTMLSTELSMLGEICIRLVAAVLLGGLIGWERAGTNHDAGLRTHIIVCLGAATIMVVSELAVVHYHIETELLRMGAQIVSGIGFLGAGSILIDGNRIRGITTAAGIWTTACIGIAIGAGFYECVLLAFVLIFIAVRTLPFVEDSLLKKARNMNIYVEFRSIGDISPILGRIKSYNVHIYEVELQREGLDKRENPCAIFSIRLNESVSHTRILASISELDTVYNIEEI